jgi:hypothetical protein
MLTGGLWGCFYSSLASSREMRDGINSSLGFVRLKRRRDWTSLMAILLMLFVPPAFGRKATPGACVGDVSL